MKEDNDSADFDEGLGTVYERFMLNRFFERLLDTYKINTVLEFPIYGITGLIGINSIYLAQKGCQVTLSDFNAEHLTEAQQLWSYLKKDCQFQLAKTSNKLPFEADSFDLVYNFAALWWVENPTFAIEEMVRLSNNLIVIFIPNKWQPGYLLRKWLLSRDYFRQVNTKWVEPAHIFSHCKGMGLKLVEKGALDIPPWPDTDIPLREIVRKLGLKGRKSRTFMEKRWHWDIVSYYRGVNPQLLEKLEKFAFIEKLSLPVSLKLLWAHHRYFLFIKPFYSSD